MTKVPKIRPEVMKQKKTRTIMKIVNNSASINSTSMKIEILAVSNLLNNFELIKKVDLLWAMWPNMPEVIKQKKNSGIGTIMKYINNFINVNHIYLHENWVASHFGPAE